MTTTILSASYSRPHVKKWTSGRFFGECPTEKFRLQLIGLRY